MLVVLAGEDDEVAAVDGAVHQAVLVHETDADQVGRVVGRVARVEPVDDVGADRPVSGREQSEWRARVKQVYGLGTKPLRAKVSFRALGPSFIYPWLGRIAKAWWNFPMQ
ncbi:MAG: hypothetical protein ACR2HJ_04740 [Fimbriimonadales bacterium]